MTKALFRIPQRIRLMVSLPDNEFSIINKGDVKELEGGGVSRSQIAVTT